MMIISGGQTGVDRAALDVAIEMSIPHGGFVTAGRMAEDGPIAARYKMTELPSPLYKDRTMANVDWADCTLILYESKLAGGTLLTWQYARSQKKPVLLITLDKVTAEEASLQCQQWIRSMHPKCLNVAGPRESKCPGIYDHARSILRKTLKKPFPF